MLIKNPTTANKDFLGADLYFGTNGLEMILIK